MLASKTKAAPPSTPPMITPAGLRGEEIRMILGDNEEEVMAVDAVEVVGMELSLLSVVYTT